jgi:hypothetical protein
MSASRPTVVGALDGHPLIPTPTRYVDHGLSGSNVIAVGVVRPVRAESQVFVVALRVTTVPMVATAYVGTEYAGESFLGVDDRGQQPRGHAVGPGLAEAPRGRTTGQLARRCYAWMADGLFVRVRDRSRVRPDLQHLTRPFVSWATTRTVLGITAATTVPSLSTPTLWLTTVFEDDSTGSRMASATSSVSQQNSRACTCTARAPPRRQYRLRHMHLLLYRTPQFFTDFNLDFGQMVHTRK